MFKLLWRYVSKLRLWLKVLRNFKGLTLRSNVNLLLSAFIDSFLYAFSGVNFNPKLMLKGLHSTNLTE